MLGALSDAEFDAALTAVDHTAYRLELQHQYQEPSERETVRRFLGGDPQPPTEVAGLRLWFEQVAHLTGTGRRIQRVRVHDIPPTDYQRWERWIGRWNAAAGEHIRYMTRAHALAVGLLPAAGNTDWWLLDGVRLIVMHFDDGGHRVHNHLVTDPEAVKQASAWWDLAVRYSAPDEIRDAATAA